MSEYYLRIFKPIKINSTKNEIVQKFISAQSLTEATDICISKMRPQDSAYIYDGIRHTQLVYIGRGYKKYKLNKEVL